MMENHRIHDDCFALPPPTAAAKITGKKNRPSRRIPQPTKARQTQHRKKVRRKKNRACKLNKDEANILLLCVPFKFI